MCLCVDSHENKNANSILWVCLFKGLSLWYYRWGDQIEWQANIMTWMGKWNRLARELEYVCVAGIEREGKELKNKSSSCL
jgi:hypothetical protein